MNKHGIYLKEKATLSMVLLPFLLLSLRAVAEDSESIEREMVSCLVDNTPWLVNLPEDPVEFHVDLCVPIVEVSDIENAVRIDIPDVTPTSPTGTRKRNSPINLSAPLRIHKSALHCLAKNFGNMHGKEIRLAWSDGVISKISSFAAELRLDTCTLVELDEKNQQVLTQ